MLYLDIETRSRTDLKKLGVYRYTEDHDFSILMMGWTDGPHRARVAVGHDEILAVPGLLDPTVTKVAHNAAFERVALGVLSESLQDPEQWLCTMALSAEYGYPTSLADVAKALGAEDKDEAGKQLVRLFTTPNRDGSWNTAETHPDEWLEFISYCLTPDHKVLGADLRWKTLGEVEVGDEILGFDEEVQPGNGGRWYRKSTVQSVRRIKLPLFEVTLASGKQFQATADHKWLVCDSGKSSGRNLRWRRTDQLLHSKGSVSVPKLLNTWEPSKSYEAGWLAGMYDGEGSLSVLPDGKYHTWSLQVAQKEGPEAERLLALTERFGRLPGSKTEAPGLLGKLDMKSIWFRGTKTQLLEFLGTVRPERLVRKVDFDKLGRMEVRGGVDQVVSVEPIGEGEVVALQTDTKTLVVDGFPMHNCAQDVDTLVDVHARLGDWPTPMERQVWIADQRINDRGMGVDLELCKFAAQAVEDNKVVNKAEFTRLTGVDNPGSGPQVKAWASDVGLGLPDLKAETVQALIDDPETDPEHVRVLELRQDLALAAGGKFNAALQVASPDSRIRGGFRFFGAHTGRWTGQRVQPQNLPRATVDDPEAAILDLKMGLGADPHTLKALVRSMFVGPYTVVDYAAIEARVLAWVANEEWALQAFRDGRDIYVETAERMSTPGNTLTRFQGKVAVLALGYNGSVGSLRAMGAEGEDADLMRLVTFWRKANSRIVQMWDKVSDAVDTGGPVGPHVRVTRNGTDMQIHLPSGRAISYHGVKWKRYVVIDPETKKRIPKQGWVYSDPKRGGHQIGTYGGRLVENITQAIARDILAEALVRLEAAGYRTVGHVHDEVIVESDALEDITRIITENPPWADGLPLNGEGFVTLRYRKG